LLEHLVVLVHDNDRLLHKRNLDGVVTAQVGGCGSGLLLLHRCFDGRHLFGQLSAQKWHDFFGDITPLFSFLNPRRLIKTARFWHWLCNQRKKQDTQNEIKREEGKSAEITRGLFFCFVGLKVWLVFVSLLPQPGPMRGRR